MKKIFSFICLGVLNVNGVFCTSPPFKAWSRALCNALREEGFTIDTGRALLNPKTNETVRGGDIPAANRVLEEAAREKERKARRKKIRTSEPLAYSSLLSESEMDSLEARVSQLAQENTKLNEQNFQFKKELKGRNC
ncbi:MAG: hypothetical protein LBS83_02995 [Holosporales bacterium]|jgi:hypothetical protein|nr:hypothetical protein [Holosporales bacterium]